MSPFTLNSVWNIRSNREVSVVEQWVRSPPCVPQSCFSKGISTDPLWDVSVSACILHVCSFLLGAYGWEKCIKIILEKKNFHLLFHTLLDKKKEAGFSLYMEQIRKRLRETSFSGLQTEVSISAQTPSLTLRTQYFKYTSQPAAETYFRHLKSSPKSSTLRCNVTYSQ